MIVRCTNILSPLGDELTTDAAITVGAEYIVLTILASPGQDVLLRVYARRPDDRDRHPGPPTMWRSQMFEVLSHSIPSNWRIEIADGGTVFIEPGPWLRRGFWEDLNDLSPTSELARQDFERELAVIVGEAE